ncbi:TPA: quinone-dependent dihydroorotate dehydrogenase [Vibrio vulnificus]|jgi:dihydroorotate dehydrogenase|uniref:Dihydroorotate dehydrogenase (quinone) n=2 Tax=Vibrio vulnificus TaxID=672 RepID=PYRD_VIBVU|nr:quinone-dependent dihydroorotate dehydrogenase [Vibrio vulnificus]Q8D9G5.1 RecName: Full=Dihydroorotate dehydrogenase (quinone); AltName: Full=DHOdehase; Short=DHOD; Short=DHODase; AltName: Full=Dihydroorotate oxidase [Vibrio vulnificus CMCP6]OJI55466.1 Dihydroorotate dehydrogenase (quinone) [Vibrio fluvialis]AAO10985.1 dihydroorotate oxidase [Vibrio vulnificus CMCP6]AIL70617.1 dihydroorotate dehydrogenase 2 [Vibrio vulnificus]ALM70965.1 Dihydroorotate dehydrogenase [Vibrio vulnificus]ANH6
MLYRLARAGFFQLDAEKAHDLAIQNFKRFTGTPIDLFYRQQLPNRPVECMGLTFRNPVGLAAGLDKNGECIEAFDAMGFGFVEVGTVTPRAQSGNDKPRLFRLVGAEGIINRMGFNNLGVDNLIENVKKAKYSCVLGINIGKNKDTPIEKGAEDYLICMEKVYEYAGYIAVNISSPNTPGLRTLQYGEALDELLVELKRKQAELEEKHGKYVPLALKIAPDLTDDEISQICQSLINNKIDGVIATNTTLDRTMVEGMKHAQEAGGLSGRPLQSRSTEVVRLLRKELQGNIPIIGVGGVDSYVAAKEKMLAGADLVQVYSGFIYHGPGLVRDIVKNL